ncbi:MAG: ATP-binding cassette domain-containing protein [Clostridia bacterium]|nr:ATP-binding cassette domain-containing protein [Clostridia bacterium]
MSYSIKNITYQYSEDGPYVLDNVDLTIEEGTVTAVVGPSGSGKSTLVEILSGVIPKLITGGVLDGEMLLKHEGEDALISVVSQSPENQLFGYGVEDAIAFGLENMGTPEEEVSERIEYVLDLLNLQHLRKRSVQALSGGQRQAVCIASVLAMNPQILIMDEPVSSLDPNGKKLIRNVLKQMKADNTTVLIVDNNLDWSADIVDRVVGLHEGKVLFEGTRDEFFHDFELQRTLGVMIPQEVEIYRTLKEMDIPVHMFYRYEDAEEQLDSLFPINENNDPDPVSEALGEPILTTHQLNKIFSDGFQGLKDINTSFPGGCVVAIMGQNGSGKTTLVKHLNGLHKPTSGDVRFRGTSIQGKSVAQISKSVILVFQHPEHMLFEQTVENELTFCARMQGLPYTDEDVMSVLSTYGMAEDRETFPLNLSMGKKHLLTILSVLLSSAEVVILDEPTLGMDLKIRSQLEDIVRNLKNEGKTVIIISHEIPMLYRMMDYALILDRSVKIFEGTKQALSVRDDIFDSIEISLPPVVRLSRRYGFDHIAYEVADFAEEAHEMYMKINGTKEGGEE